jgi:hypothetical protein
VVAALPGLRDVHPWEVAAANVHDPFGRFPLGRRRRSTSGLRALARAIASESESGDCAETGRAMNSVAKTTETTRPVSCWRASMMSRALMAAAFRERTLVRRDCLRHGTLQVTGAILRDLSLAGHARAVEVLDRQSGEAGRLCGGAPKLCRASEGDGLRSVSLNHRSSPGRDSGCDKIAPHSSTDRAPPQGDALVLDTPVATEQYRVEWIRITHPGRCQCDRLHADSSSDARRLLPVLSQRSGPAAVHRACCARGGIASTQLTRRPV